MNIFTRIIEWIKGAFAKMIGTNDLKQKVGVDVAVSAKMLSALELWTRMYENNAEWLSEDIHSCGLPAAIASDIARLATIEMKVEVTGSPMADVIMGVMEKMLPRIRQQLESGIALGGVIWKPYIVGKKIAIDCVHADQFFPVSFDADGNITSCVFVDSRTVGNKFYTRFELHQLLEFEGASSVKITNAVFKSDSVNSVGTSAPFDSVDDWKKISQEETIKNVVAPLYGYCRYPMANNIDSNSPLGVSAYSRATDLIKQADYIWSNLLWEFESGKRALYVDESAFDRDSTTDKKVLRDKRLFRTLSGMNTAELGAEGFFQEWSPDFREAAIKAGLNDVFQRIEYSVGLAYGTVSDPQSVDKTATEIKMSRQRSYATVTDVQKALKSALDQLMYAISVWASLYGLAGAGTWSTVYDFDDSVITDKDLQFQQDSRMVTQSLMSPVEFRMRNFGEDETTARKMLAMIEPATPEPFGV